MAELNAVLTKALQNEVSKQGIKIYLKTDVGPRLKVYDADEPGGTGVPLVNFGVKVTDREGKELASYGGQPATNYLKSGVLLVCVVGVAALIVRGFKKC